MNRYTYYTKKEKEKKKNHQTHIQKKYESSNLYCTKEEEAPAIATKKKKNP